MHTTFWIYNLKVRQSYGRSDCGQADKSRPDLDGS